ncbi:coiled-coil domain-containing protein 39 [Pectinophora gossypiella]|nr:coiled-coil domain-containing protein 39 [Pectinophora gossypiella]
MDPLDKLPTVPRYMDKLLKELGWNQGTRIPLANPDNQDLENNLINRQNEIQRLKEALIFQNQKRKDLNKYKNNVLTEYQENTRLLFAHKNQMEQEVKLRQLACNEADRLDRDIIEYTKKSKDLNGHLDRFQGTIAKLLKRADTLKSEVCGERGALQEWRAALDRCAGDITAIEQFTKQDTSKAKELETQRQKLKVEHDRMHERLTQLMSNLAAEERACERISIQVIEGMERRKQMMSMWTAAVENLRQRDTDIRHIREDYAVLEEEAKRVAEQCREQQSFFDQQKGNNIEAERENTTIAHRIGQMRVALAKLQDANVTLDGEVKSLHRELGNMQTRVEKLHMQNRRTQEEQQRKDNMLRLVNERMRDLREKLEDSADQSKSSEIRAKQLESMLNDEERYATNLTHNQQRAMHCSFVEQQKLLALQNEEKLFHMQIKAAKAVMGKLDNKQAEIEKKLQTQKESLYSICYQVETLGARVMEMEGSLTERDCSAELVEKENRLKDVCARHMARVTMLERHSARLHDDMRRLARDLEQKNIEHCNLQSRLKTSLLNVEGGDKEVKAARGVWRRERVEEALLRLRVAHAARAVAGFQDTAFTLDTQRLHLDAAMNERLVEIGTRRDMFTVQKRSLLEDCGKLRSDIREREQRIDQLIKRYDIFIASLGKDDSGQQLSVAFFKIKFAAERAELREKGAALDADITRRERDVSALEATMRVVAAAHSHFLHHINPLSDDAPEMEELHDLMQRYFEMRDEIKVLKVDTADVELRVGDASARLTALSDKCKQLTAREAEAEAELENARDRLAKQEVRLQNAKDIVKHNAKRAKKLIEGVDDWRIFQMALWVRDYAESAHNSLHALNEVCTAPESVRSRFAALVSSTDIQRHMSRHQRRLQLFVQRIVSDATSTLKDVQVEMEESVFSTSSDSNRSGVSQASGFTRRLASFRKTLAAKVQEEALVDEIPEQARRSTISLRVITLGLEESVPIVESNLVMRTRKFR